MPSHRPPSLPEPDAASAAHSERVAAFIREHIDIAGGSISFAEFMHHALYAPGLGYYTSGSAKFGEEGDFVTAPEVSAVFGRVVARQCADVLAQFDGGAILEYGAGSGKLAVDMLEALAELDALPSAYRILEVSPDLVERQQACVSERVPGLAHLVEWIDTVPDALRGVIVANEVLDSMPVERFVRREAGVMQLRVAVDDRGFRYLEAPAPDNLAHTVAVIEKDLGRRLPDGYLSEVCLATAPWIGGLSHTLREGIAFLFDYGVARREYFARDRSRGWLRCHFRHHAHDDPFVLPGIQDMTAWVDFSGVANAAAAQGLDVVGYTSQAQFLIAGGLDAVLADFTSRATAEQMELSRQVKTLTLPGEMGERFKCIALGKGIIERPGAFGLADRTHTL
ncbi:MAG: SAM-dependent methyltransferase [Woeseiaceae bacterium]|jgi:SAM-dependent MidA family methyltransferase